MSIALDPDHGALAEAVRGFAGRHAPSESTRDQFDKLAAGGLPPSWPALVEQGYTAVHLPEPHGMDSWLGLAVVVEETARALVPGPLLPTVLASGLLARAAVRSDLVERLAGGATAAVALSGDGMTAQRRGDGYLLSGQSAPLLGAPGADLLVLGADADGEQVWLVVEADRSGITVAGAEGVDLTRGIGRVHADAVEITPAGVVPVSGEQVSTRAGCLFAAEAVGIVGWYVAAATDYAKLREQFGRPIGSFQAIKHKLARMFIALQVMSAAAWDAARALEDNDDEQAWLASAAAVSVCLPAAVELGLETITLFGGIGYTWEHDAHLYWRRAIALEALAGPVEQWRQRLGDAARHSSRRFDIELPDEDPAFRDGVRQALAEVGRLDGKARRDHLAAAGLVLPHYPAPYGLSATAAQQIVIAQEYERAGVAPPKTVIGEWALPTILAHGTEEQKDFFVPATLRGEITWCQLFSEPGAGSDLASLATKAERVDGGWRLTGQKIWTSSAHQADWGICLARTDPGAPKHKGISYFLVDMHSPGVEIRPLREANGNYMFNEVFLTDVFVPDDRLVGEVNGGWRLARTTLSNERVSMGGMAQARLPIVEIASRDDLVADRAVVDRGLGMLTAEGQALSAMHLRDVLRRLSGLQPGVEGSAMKVAAGWHHVHVTTEVMRWLGPQAATLDGPGGAVTMQYLSSPPMLIGGGTVEIQLNVIAERILGLPRG